MIKVEPFPKDIASWQSPTAGTDLPYDFVPVALRPGKAAGEEVPFDSPEAPVWHDGANTDQGQLYSGELRCSLKALSPLLVANQQVSIEELTTQARTMVEGAPAVSLTDFVQEVENRKAALLASLQQQLNTTTDRRQREEIEKKIEDARSNFAKLIDKPKVKKVLFPLTLSSDGPVLIPGESLKGMCRQALGALLSSPVERVQEGSFSSRPNAYASHGSQTRPCAAHILRYDEDKLELEVALIEDISAVEFVYDHEPTAAGRNLSAGKRLGAQSRIDNKQRIQKAVNNQVRHRWIDHREGTALPDDYVYLRYHYALDSKRYFKQLVGGPGKNHPGAFVPMTKIDPQPIRVDPAVVRQYLDTFCHLRDGRAGHLSRNNNGKPDPASILWPNLAPGDLIFVEWLKPANGQTGRVISFGHNFRYRWKHLDTVTARAIGFDGSEWRFGRRPELTAHPDERPKESSVGEATPPLALSAVRNLFGHVIVPPRSRDSELASPYGALAGLKDPFNRMAGRIAFNIAMERVSESDTFSKRFVNADRGGYLFLHPAVSPNASFAPGYVPGVERSWGDGLVKLRKNNGTEVYALQNGTGHFAGRKFYPHQFVWKAETGKLELKQYHYDLSDLLQQSWGLGDTTITACSRWDLEQYLWSDQSAVAARVSRAGRAFGFAVRFKDLRAWELAALAAALNPRLLANTILAPDAGGALPLTRNHLIDRAQRVQQGEKYAFAFGHKLGHGRAMGLGSVQIRIDHCELWSSPAKPTVLKWQDLFRTLIREHLLERLDDATARQWLKVLQFVPERPARPYLLHRDAQGQPQSLLKWAQDLRASHTRRGRNQGFGPGVALADLPVPPAEAGE